LLVPLLPGLDSRRTLVFDLDDTMEFLPVAALPVDGKEFGGKYLGLQFATSTLHSMLLADRRASADSRLQQGLIVGASDPGDPGIPRLPEAKTEAEAVAAFLVRSRVFVGEDAQAGSIAARVPRAALIHFAGHTQTVGGATRLLLAQPAGAERSAKTPASWLDAGTFRSRDLSGCRLVVLSACSTGKREERDFNDIQDIVQTLTASGAQQIVATHWDVDSSASAVLMEAFYSGLARGLTVPRALLEAKSALSADPAYRHPYYWAPYYVFGMSKSNLKELFHDD
jgi:CHAT domain-containing protein